MAGAPSRLLKVAAGQQSAMLAASGQGYVPAPPPPAAISGTQPGSDAPAARRPSKLTLQSVEERQPPLSPAELPRLLQRKGG